MMSCLEWHELRTHGGKSLEMKLGREAVLRIMLRNLDPIPGAREQLKVLDKRTTRVDLCLRMVTWHLYGRAGEEGGEPGVRENSQWKILESPSESDRGVDVGGRG